MNGLRLFALIGALMLSSAVVCAAGMVLPGLLPGGSLALPVAVSFGAQALALLGLVIWLRSTLRREHARTH
jgi:hypothetical protein